MGLIKSSADVVTTYPNVVGAERAQSPSSSVNFPADKRLHQPPQSGRFEGCFGSASGWVTSY